MEKQLLTMAQIAKQLNLGEGRKKRYKSETVEVLRFIAEGFKRNLTATDIEDGLSRMVARNIEVEKETAITTAATQQQPENELKQYTLQLQIALEQMSATMQIIATFSFYSSLHKAPYRKF